MTEKPHVLRQVELDSASKRGEALTDLFAERNLNLPKTVAQTPRPEASSQSMSKALDSALKSEMARDIYPSMNFFRTEEKQADSRRFKSYDNLSREDAVAVFKDALREAGVTVTWKWEDANRVVMNDPRVKALKAISERKQAFNDFVNEIKTRERNESRSRRQMQREAFVEMLKEHKALNSLSKYYQVARVLQSDPRFKNTEEKDREEIFQDFLDELFNKEREVNREQSEKTVEKLKEHFHKLNIDADSKWVDVHARLKDDAFFAGADSLEQITAFEDYIKALERLEF